MDPSPICKAVIIFLEENMGVKPCDLWLGNSFLDMTLKVQATKYKIQNKLNFI